MAGNSLTVQTVCHPRVMMKSSDSHRTVILESFSVIMEWGKGFESIHTSYKDKHPYDKKVIKKVFFDEFCGPKMQHGWEVGKYCLDL